MALFGNKDNPVTANTTTTKMSSNGAPIGTAALVMKGGGANAHYGNTSGTRASTEVNLFANTTQNAFVSGKAVGVFAVNSASMASHKEVAHSGWVLRTVGSGGRAGRVQTEVLVAGGISGAKNANNSVY